MEKGLVSIITPTYNCAQFIGETIRAIQAQSYDKWEMIIVDDCSTDNTDEVVKKYLVDKRIRYIKNEKNIGAALSRNKALKLARGKWIAFLDSDDLWDSQKLEKQIQFMIEHNYYFSYTRYEEIDEYGKKLGKEVYGPKKISKIGMYAYCWPGCLTVMYDAEYVGVIQIENLEKNNDYAMWLKIVEKCPCYLLNENLAQYRRRIGSISNHRKSSLVKYHYYLYRVGMKRGKLFSTCIMCFNLFFGLYKKVRYVKK